MLSSRMFIWQRFTLRASEGTDEMPRQQVTK